MFLSITRLSEAEQTEVLASLDASPEWELTWDIGLVDYGDSFAVMPRWGAWEVAGRWPAAFPLGRNHQFRPWRYVSDASPGYSCPRNLAAIPLEQVGVSVRHAHEKESDATMKCPNCGAQDPEPESTDNGTTTCPRCGHRFPIEMPARRALSDQTA